MECPRCHSDEIGSDGICLACKYRVSQSDVGEIKSKNLPQKSPVETGSSPPQEELPPWRQQLSQRLTALKKNEGTSKSSLQVKSENDVSKPQKTATRIHKRVDSTPPKQAGTIKTPKQIPKIQPAPRSSHSPAPQQKTIASLGPEVYTSGAETESSNRATVRNLIDSAVTKKSTPHIEKTPIFRPETAAAEKSKFILLSRTLSGLIDLIVIILCTGVFIISADYFSGIVQLDRTSLIEFAGLFLLIFFFYSIFFLSTSAQTIGMMITELRIIGIEGTRPSIGQLFSRCLGYLLSILILGAGLFWSLVDRQNRCFHDRFSNTSITRLRQ